MWNLGKWYWWTDLQGRNGDADVEHGLVDTVGTQWVGRMEKVASTCIHYHMQNGPSVRSCCITQGAQSGGLWWPRGVGWGKGGRLKREGIYIYNYGWYVLYGRNQQNIVKIKKQIRTSQKHSKVLVAERNLFADFLRERLQLTLKTQWFPNYEKKNLEEMMLFAKCHTLLNALKYHQRELHQAKYQ